MKEIKAIQTRYKNCFFRSRLEARWAVFFDALGIEWEYEKEGFKTPHGWYLPDFYLPKTKWFVEIKGTETDITGNLKSQYLNDNPPKYAIGATTVIGDPISDKFDVYMFSKNVCGVCDIEKIYTASIRARSARFEHGARGNVLGPSSYKDDAIKKIVAGEIPQRIVIKLVYGDLKTVPRVARIRIKPGEERDLTWRGETEELKKLHALVWREQLKQTENSLKIPQYYVRDAVKGAEVHLSHEYWDVLIKCQIFGKYTVPYEPDTRLHFLIDDEITRYRTYFIKIRVVESINSASDLIKEFSKYNISNKYDTVEQIMLVTSDRRHDEIFKSAGIVTIEPESIFMVFA